MQSLVIDTSVFGASMGLLRDNDLVWQWHDLEQRRCSAGLSQALTMGLRESGFALGQLDQVIVGVGPGSFTGIKVGLAWVYGLHAGLQVPCRGVSALEVALEKLPPEAAVLLPGTRDFGYMAWEEGGQRRSRGISLEELTQLTLDKQWFLVGDWPEVGTLLKSQSLELAELQAYVLQGMAEYGAELYSSSDLPQPCYLRASRAEERRSQGALS